jgi:hypothetical protein
VTKESQLETIENLLKYPPPVEFQAMNVRINSLYKITGGKGFSDYKYAYYLHKIMDMIQSNSCEKKKDKNGLIGTWIHQPTFLKNIPGKVISTQSFRNDLRKMKQLGLIRSEGDMNGTLRKEFYFLRGESLHLFNSEILAKYGEILRGEKCPCI